MRAIARLSVGLVGLLTLGSGTLVLAQLIPPAGPASPASAKFTLGDVFLRLTTGAAGARRAGAFTEPAPGPIGATMVTTDQVMAAAPAMDDTSGAGAGDVLAGKTYWGLRSASWGQLTGTMATQLLSGSSTAVAAGYYATTDLATVDADLAAANIKSGVSIFGINGTVIGSTGTATAADVLAPKTFSNATTVGVTGTMATQLLSASSTTVLAGYYAGTSLAIVEADLATGNIRSGVSIFGIAGDPNVVNTVTGDAVSGEIASGKKAWVDGVEITGSNYPAPVEKTGQTQCYDASNVLTTCPGTPAGQDGALQKGAAWPNPRFTDNGNGTVADNLTGLIWLKNANCYGGVTWSVAMGNVATLDTGACGLTGASTLGQWRVPNRFELESLLDLAYASPAISNTAGTGRWTEGNPFTNVRISFYWSSSAYVDYAAIAWLVDVYYGGVNAFEKTNTGFVWPVRGGQ